MPILGNPMRTTPGRALAGLLIAASLSLAAPAARADEFLDKLNASLADVKNPQRSDLVLLPLLAKVQPPPAKFAKLESLAAIYPGSPAMAELASWAGAPTQKAVLDAIASVTKEDDYRKAMAFAQPYGVEGVSVDMVAARLYTELGDPPSLAGAKFYYLDAIRTMELLAHADAVRRAGEGDTIGAVKLLCDWTFFCRQMADRRFYREVVWGYEAMIAAQERLRDIAYWDSRTKKALDQPAQRDQLAPLVARIDENKGYLEISRLRLPIGDRMASEQAVARVYQPRAGVDTSVFATTMSRMGSSEFPLRLFGETARWQAVAATQKNWFEINDQLPKLYVDWESRWRLDPFDKLMEKPFVYSSFDRAGFAVLDATAPDMSRLFTLRQQLQVELAGTRQALAIIGYSAAAKAFPPQLSSVRPQWVKALSVDAYNPSRARGAVPPFEYFVPVRDQKVDARGEAKPHEVKVFVSGGANFDLKLREDQFLLYSTGRDGANNYAARVDNRPDAGTGTDYLIWPPVSSLYRQHLIDRGEIK
ncbi:MAG: hypothetical protein JNL50_13425 [Phycisphaerae bacterium]|nr:hypothetical protein [Phycisphaerae bacterium]